MQQHLSSRTVREYEWYVRRWESAGFPDPAAWVEVFAGAHQRRNARAALLWHHRTNLRTPLSLEPQHALRKVPVAFTQEELHRLLKKAHMVHARCEPVLQLLYSTGARVNEAAGITPEDITSTHIILKETKRRPGGLRVERPIPLGRRSRQALADLAGMPLGRVQNVIGVRAHTVQDWCRDVSKLTEMHVHAHKLRATFCTHLLQRGVPVHEVRVLMGHTDLATTLRYAAVTDKRLASAVALL